MHIAHGTILFFAALLAGAINSVAGGGSFVSFPTLLFVGIPPINANATNTVALWPGQPASVWAYRTEFRSLPRRVLVPLTVTGILGGFLGAYVLLITPPATLDRKSTRLNSSHLGSSYAVFCLNKEIADFARGRDHRGQMSLRVRDLQRVYPNDPVFSYAALFFNPTRPTPFFTLPKPGNFPP